MDKRCRLDQFGDCRERGPHACTAGDAIVKGGDSISAAAPVNAASTYSPMKMATLAEMREMYPAMSVDLATPLREMSVDFSDYLQEVRRHSPGWRGDEFTRPGAFTVFGVDQARPGAVNHPIAVFECQQDGIRRMEKIQALLDVPQVFHDVAKEYVAKLFGSKEFDACVADSAMQMADKDAWRHRQRPVETRFDIDGNPFKWRNEPRGRHEASPTTTTEGAVISNVLRSAHKSVREQTVIGGRFLCQ